MKPKAHNFVYKRTVVGDLLSIISLADRAFVTDDKEKIEILKNFL